MTYGSCDRYGMECGRNLRYSGQNRCSGLELIRTTSKRYNRRNHEFVELHKQRTNRTRNRTNTASAALIVQRRFHLPDKCTTSQNQGSTSELLVRSAHQRTLETGDRNVRRASFEIFAFHLIVSDER